MLPQERYAQILSLFNTSDVVKIKDIMESFHVSVETARRDLTYLEKNNLIKKVYGGAVLINKEPKEAASTTRLFLNQAQKEAIGKKCSEFINDGDFIIIESGTTTLQVAKYLRQKKNLTVVTNSIYVINELLDSDVCLYIIGGKVRHEERALSGPVSLNELDRYQAMKTIVGAGGITAKNGISDFYFEEILVRQKMIERSRQTILVADSSKFGHDAPGHVCSLDRIDTIITNHLNSEILQSFGNQQKKFVFAD